MANIGSQANQSPIAPFLSPLRYPGGKRKLANFIKLVYHYNDLLDGDYIELFAGGASIALSLLFEEYVRQIWINDLDRSIYAFWYSILNCSDKFSQLVEDTPVSMDEWHNQKRIQSDPNASTVELGFSTFFLNRTNRSGIISGGVIGGKNQTGKWKLDARFKKGELLTRISKIERYKDRIHLYNLDASSFIRDVLPNISTRSLVYLDPPYYVKGSQLLYSSFYRPEDHAELAELVGTIKQKWIVSYDNVSVIHDLYHRYRSIDYTIHYSAQDKYRGAEIMFFSSGLVIPDVINPSNLKRKKLQKYLV